MTYLLLQNPCRLTFLLYSEQSKNFLLADCIRMLLLLHSSFTPFDLAHIVLDHNFSGLLRSILGNLEVPRHVRLFTYAKCAVNGLEKQSKMESGK